MNLTIVPGIPGLVTAHPNQYFEKLKTTPWTQLSTILGKNGDKILIRLFQECGIYVPLSATNGSLNQVSGKPLCDLSPLQPGPSRIGSPSLQEPAVNRSPSPVSRKPTTWNDIRFVRHRILYGRPAYTATGRVSFGHRPIHVMNRQPDDDTESVRHLLKYVFPRQHGLHNVFTSQVDRKDSAHQYLDYTLREKEIKRQDLREKKVSVPKRLRGSGQALFSAVLKRHAKCSYGRLLNHYCPATSSRSSLDTQDVLGRASSATSVSAFSRAVINHVFPTRLWGDGAEGLSNRGHIMAAIDKFVKLQRYESMSLHDVMQNIKISHIRWLDPPRQECDQRLSTLDFAKRQEIIAELVYYLCDSFLIPLISSNFYVTESSSCRNQLFYFRHDVWQWLSEPALLDLKTNMFEEVDRPTFRMLMSRRTLGTSHVRLLPKDSGVRPIINLRRRVLSKAMGKPVLGKSINSAMTPVFNALNYEKGQHDSRLGASIFSADEIFPRLQEFRVHLSERGLSGRPLYFAKADVRSCFDTIPQDLLMSVVSRLFSASEYAIGRYAEGKAVNKSKNLQAGFSPRVAWKFLGRAVPANQDKTLSQTLNDLSSGDKPGNVFVDSVVRRYEGKRKMINLLEEHIQNNLVQIGSALYRQKTGIPQGSIVSSLLCSLFYAEMEEKVLTFVKDGESLLLRLIDDFLLITTNKQTAQRFMQVLHSGLPKYGVTIKREKSVVNFDMEIDNQKITRLPLKTDFAYCGQSINTENLNLSKDTRRRDGTSFGAPVTVEFSKLPGQSFYRKTLSLLKLHMHSMLLSTSFNEEATVKKNLYFAFTDIAQRCLHYIKRLSSSRCPSSQLVINTVNDLTNLAFATMQQRQSKSTSELFPYKCGISRSQTRR
ncbi:hypothetical protein MBLNU457_g2995t1 [Dothideomycetes sp. NU457]